MKMKSAIVVGGLLVAGVGAAAFGALPLPSHEAVAVSDPRQEPPLVRWAAAAPVANAERRFTGTIGARVESNLGFRVPGKIVERLVSAGEPVAAGQPLMRIDDTDLQLALAARRSAVAAAQAVFVQVSADEKRYAALVKNGIAASPQRYEQAKSALDTAAAQRAVAEAEARVAENEAAYAVLVADADGTIVETFGEPGQVVLPGQTVVRLAQAGPREAVVALPETIRPEIGSSAEARLYGEDGRPYTAHLRQLSHSADAQTRTFEARYVLDGEAAGAPLGATVTVRIADQASRPQVQVPLGAVLDNGEKTGVWLLVESGSAVTFQPVELVRLSDEAAVVSGLNLGDPVVSLGAHLLQEGARVRTASEGGAK
jgi:RND family efflux transporter MFP subunit